MKASTETFIIPATEGHSFTLRQGQTFKIIDEVGQQVADLIAYCANNHKERIDSSVTMDVLRSTDIKVNQSLYSNLYRPMLSVVKDTVGKHDFLNSACRPEMYALTYQKLNHANCYDNLNHALVSYGISPPDQHYAFNIFMNTAIDEQGRIQVKAPLSNSGDYIMLKAEMDLIIAISACPCAESICNGYLCTPIRVEVYD